METRLVIAYTLIVLMACLAVFGLVMVQKKRSAKQRRGAERNNRH